MGKHVTVAVDGPSGAGKSTLARAAAERFGLLYVDTGAIYRTLGLAVRRRGIDKRDAARVVTLLPALDIDLRHDAGGLQRMFLDGEDVTDEIRLPEISMYASAVSAIPAVRDYLMDMQRGLARRHSVIMDGRDIGTVVLPDAGLKVFLTAAPDARARRRLLELERKGIPAAYEDVLRDILRRDEDDTARAAAPLRRAEDAVLLDTTELDFAQSWDALCALIRESFSL